jgi:NitT/TauT family transport system permease protein
MDRLLAMLGIRGPQGLLGIRENVGTPLKVFLGVIPVVVIFAVWILATTGEAEERLISPTILPSPGEVVRSFHSLWFEAELSRSILASAFRVVVGFAVGCVFAMPLGILMGAFTKVRALLDPLAVFLGYLPIPALVPLTMSMFGVDEMQKVMFLALAFFIYLLPLFVRTVDDVDNVFLQTAYTLGASRWQALRQVLVPVALPRIVHAMRLGFGVGWTYIILAEMVAAERGLGQIIIVAQRRGPREHIYLVLVVIVLIAYLTDRLWIRLGRRLFPYQEAR